MKYPITPYYRKGGVRGARGMRGLNAALYNKKHVVTKETIIKDRYRIEFKKIPSVSIYIKVEGSQRTVDIYIN